MFPVQLVNSYFLKLAMAPNCPGCFHVTEYSEQPNDSEKEKKNRTRDIVQNVESLPCL